MMPVFDMSLLNSRVFKDWYSYVDVVMGRGLLKLSEHTIWRNGYEQGWRAAQEESWGPADLWLPDEDE